MTERYGELKAVFIESDDAAHSIITYNGTSFLGNIVRAEVTKKLGQMQRGKFVLRKSTGWDGLVVEGRIVGLSQTNAVLGSYREMGSFIVQSVREKLEQSGEMVVEVSGLGPEHLLTKQRHWAPIGEETIIAAELDDAAAAPWTTTVAVGCPTGNDSVSLTSDAGLEEGDEIRIQMNNSAWYVGKITNPDPPGMPSGVVQMLPRITGDADTGNAVELRKARLVLVDVTGLEADQQVTIQLNTGTLETLITEVVTGTTTIVVAAGLPVAASAGNSVTVYDYSEPATDDVEQIMSPLGVQWNVRYQAPGAEGSTNGTSHTPVGESVFDLLQTVGEQTGEFWRFDDLSGGFLPRKQLFWQATWDHSGTTLYVRSTNADVAADTETEAAAVVYSLERERTSDIITRIYPVAADGRIELSYCSPTALSSASGAGFTVVISDDLYEPDYVQYGPGVTAYGVQQATMRFANVTLAKRAKFAELRQAADAMLLQAMTAIMESQAREYWRARVHSHRPLFPGEAVTIHNTTTMQPTGVGTFYLLEVKETYDAGGVIMTDLRMSSTSRLEPTTLRSLGKALAATEKASRRTVGEGTATDAAAATIPGSGGDHGTLTGLGDDDHPHYLKADGTRVLTGSMAVAAGMTVDGVDISAHAADAAAHHDPVTAADTSITVSDQTVKIADAAAGDGLGISGGAMYVKTGAAYGTTVTADTVAVSPDTSGGLELNSGGLRVKRPTNSGLALGGLGLSVSPAAVSASSTNTPSGSDHSHLVTAVEDSKTTPGELMKASADGDHTLRYLTADRVQTPLIVSTAAMTIDPGAGLLSLDGDLTFTGGSRVVRTASGDLSLAPVGELQIDPANNIAEVQPSVTLKTSHWASGFLGTGWGLSYDGHFDTRSIYADELHVAAFIADTARVVVGSEYITPGMALLAEDFTIPSVGGSGTLTVDDAPGLTGAVFDNNDWVLLRVMNRAGGGLLVANVWGQVASYVDGPEEGQQRWTFTVKSTTAVGQVVAAGSVALGFGKSGAGWWWVTTNDLAGSPYAGISTWQGTDPYTPGNRTHVLRMGQLKGVSGVYEWGLRAGPGTSRHVTFSDLRSEIHGSRLSLYAGDGAQLRVAAVEVRLYRDVSTYSTLTPNADHSSVNVISTGGTFYGGIDEGVSGYSTADYVANDTNTSGVLFVSLTDPSPWGAVYGATVRGALVGSGFSNDTVTLYAQVFASDETTPLTAEALVYAMTGNTNTSVERSFQQVDTASTQSQWNGARLRLRWEYTISSSEEAIRLDPQVPSIAVGRVLPSGYSSGGDGLWVGSDSGTYKLRIGKAAGAGLRWTGTALELRNSSGTAMIELDSSGNSRFAGPMTIGTSGGIWQGTGTFASPTTGLKIWNDGGVGRLATYSGGSAQLAFDTSGRLVAGELTLSSAGLAIRSSSSIATPISFQSFGSGVAYGNIFSAGDATSAITGIRSWRPGVLANMGYLALHTNSIDGDMVQMAISASGVANIVEIKPASTDSYKGLRVTGGVLVGSRTFDAPSTNVVRMVAAASTSTFPNTSCGDLLLVNDGSGQKLYFKFGNGTLRLLASA